MKPGRKPGSPNKAPKPKLFDPISPLLSRRGGPVQSSEYEALVRLMDFTERRDVVITGFDCKHGHFWGGKVSLPIDKYSLRPGASITPEIQASVNSIARWLTLRANGETLLKKYKTAIAAVTGCQLADPTSDDKGRVLSAFASIACGSAEHWENQVYTFVRRHEGQINPDGGAMEIFPAEFEIVAVSILRCFDSALELLKAVRDLSGPRRHKTAMAAWLMVDWNAPVADILPLVTKLADCSESLAGKARLRLPHPDSGLVGAQTLCTNRCGE